jgi:hypothetical protein
LGGDRGAWRAATPPVSPSPRTAPAMVYDRTQQRVVLFGGADAGGWRNDTWTYGGATWAPVASVMTPPGLWYPMLAHDAVRGETVLHGANVNAPGAGSQTWVLASGQWTSRGAGPPGRALATFVYDEARHVCVLLGRAVFASTAPAESWRWNGANWAIDAVAPPAELIAVAACYDRQRARIVATNGFATWALGVPGGAVAAPFGAGCGTPPLQLAAGSGTRPQLGTTQQLDVTGAPLGFAFVLFGWSNERVGRSALPYSMAPLGMPGCELLTSSELTLFAPGSGSTAAASFALPTAVEFVGAHLFAQAWAPAPGANAGGALTSNGLSLFVGSN